jgi:hypothetical protein
MKKCIIAACSVAVSTGAFGGIVGMTDSTGNPLIARLLEGSGVDASKVRFGRSEYVGVTSGFAQAGLFDGLTLRGDQGTSQTLSRGIVLTSGSVTGLPDRNTTGSYSVVAGTGGNNYFRDFPAQTGTSRHSGRLQEHDENSITFDLFVPAGIVGMRTDFVYGSEEFPEWSGTQYADGFGVFVNGVNYARLSDGRPVSLLSESDNIHFMTNGDSMDASIPSVADLEYDGLTRILELTSPLVPGTYNTITMVVADTGDEIYDSAVFLSSLRFIAGDSPLTPDDCKVRMRRRSGEDDSYVEFGSLPTPGTAVMLALALGATNRRRRR